MDRPLTLPWWRKRLWINTALATLVVGIVIASVVAWLGPTGRRLRAEQQKLSIATVTTSMYQDFIPFRGTVVRAGYPPSTVSATGEN